MLILYGLKTCDTCRKALKALSSSGQEVEFVDVRSDPPGAEFYARLVAQHGTAALNTRSRTWAGLNDAERALPIEVALARHPALMKRPVTEAGATLYLGWTEAVRGALMP